MATWNGQTGFWAKREQDAAPIFVGLPPGETDIEKWKNDWRIRSNTQWVGDTAEQYNVDMAAGKPQQFTPAAPDTVADTYFDVMLKDIEQTSRVQTERANQGYDTFVRYLKEGRALFDEDLSRSYAKSLSKINENAYARNVGRSGIRENNFREAGTERDFQVKQKDIQDRQKEEIANEERRQRLQDIEMSAARSRASMKSPYATYQY